MSQMEKEEKAAGEESRHWLPLPRWNKVERVKGPLPYFYRLEPLPLSIPANRAKLQNMHGGLENTTPPVSGG